MTNEEYLSMQYEIKAIATLIMSIPGDKFDGFLARIETADAVGPILHPSLWVRGNKALSKVRAIATALADARAKIAIAEGETRDPA